MHCKLLNHLRVDLFTGMSDIFNIANISDNDVFKMIMSAADFDAGKILLLKLMYSVIRYSTTNMFSANIRKLT